MDVFIIKRICSEWDGCNGCSTTESYLNWVYESERDCQKKVDELNEKWGHRGPGHSTEFELEKQDLIPKSA